MCSHFRCQFHKFESLDWCFVMCLEFQFKNLIDRKSSFKTCIKVLPTTEPPCEAVLLCTVMVLRTDKILWSNISENWIIKITFTFARISTLHMSKAGFYKVINISWSLDENVGGMSLKSGCLWELFCHINWSISRVSSPRIISLHITQTRQEIISFMCFQLPCKDTLVYHHNHNPASQQTEHRERGKQW